MSQPDDELFGAEHVRVYRETGGARGYRWRGTTILLLTTTGRTSGEQRTTPLIHRTDGDTWIVIASKAGAPEHPAWYLNLRAEPEAEIQVEGEVVPVVATDAEGEERTRLWGLMTEAWPAYDEYAAKTEREIPVVVFTRGAAGARLTRPPPARAAAAPPLGGSPRPAPDARGPAR